MLSLRKSKFSYIKYPFFGCYEVPEVTITFDKIIARTNNSDKVVKITNTKAYLEQLMDLELLEDVPRFKFRMTASNTSELIMSTRRCVWGVDSEGGIHNLKRHEFFAVKCVKPIKITKGKYVWFNEITKPVVTPLSINNIQEDILYYWFTFLYIDNVWELYSISPEYEEKKVLWT